MKRIVPAALTPCHLPTYSPLMVGLDINWTCEDCDERQSFHLDLEGHKEAAEKDKEIYLAICKYWHKRKCGK